MKGHSQHTHSEGESHAQSVSNSGGDMHIVRYYRVHFCGEQVKMKHKSACTTKTQKASLNYVLLIYNYYALKDLALGGNLLIKYSISITYEKFVRLLVRKNILSKFGIRL